MSKHNYTQYSNAKKYDNKPKIEEPVEVAESANPVEATEFVEPAVEVKMVEETVKTVPIPKTINGVVSNCTKLNIRKDPSVHAEILGVVDVDSEMKIDMDKSNDKWFYVSTAVGIDGYCMRDFVNAKL